MHPTSNTHGGSVTTRDPLHDHDTSLNDDVVGRMGGLGSDVGHTTNNTARPACHYDRVQSIEPPTPARDATVPGDVSGPTPAPRRQWYDVCRDKWPWSLALLVAVLVGVVSFVVSRR